MRNQLHPLLIVAHYSKPHLPHRLAIVCYRVEKTANRLCLAPKKRKMKCACLLLAILLFAGAGADPCSDGDTPPCPEGTLCRAVYHPDLTQVPVAVCEGDDQHGEAEEGQCKQFTVGESMTSCKSMDGWREAGHSQCALRGAEEGQTHLMHMEVLHACHKKKGKQTTFLQASFTCCPPDLSTAKPITERPTQAHSSGPPTKPAQPTKPDMHVAVYEQTSAGPTGSPGLVEEGEGEGVNTVYLWALGAGMAVFIALALSCIAIRHRCENQRSRLRKSPSTSGAVTFYINPMPTMEEDNTSLTGDTHTLIRPQHP